MTLRFNRWRRGNAADYIFNEIARVLDENTRTKVEKIAKAVSGSAITDESSGVIKTILGYGDMVATAVKPIIPVVGLASLAVKKVSATLGSVSLKKIKSRIE